MKKAVYDALCACFSLPPDSEEAAEMFRETDSVPDMLPDRDTVHYRLVPAPYTNPERLRRERPGRRSCCPEYFTYPEFRLKITCYGPNAWRNSEQLRIFIFLGRKGEPRTILRQAGIFLLPNPRAADITFEQTNGGLRTRAALEIPVTVLPSAEILKTGA